MGWETGFHYYILGVPLVIFLSLWPISWKILVCVFNGMVYLFLNYYSSNSIPLTLIDSSYVNWFNSFNIVNTIFTISFCAFYYRIIVLKAEEKLEIAHQDTIKVLARLNENLSDAADYVKSILPEPICEGSVRLNWEFIPSESLGGDAFGYHWLDNDNLAIYLFDVSGHGVSAALLSATIMNVLRSHSLSNVNFNEPDQVLSGLNRSFPSEKNNDMFFTIWYGVYNKPAHHIAYASGGHPPALLFSEPKNKNFCVTQLRTRNNIIGGFITAVYKKDIQALKEKACLYVFSDGVYEFLQPDGKRWRYNEFVSLMTNLHLGDEKDIDRLVNYVKELNKSDIFEDDFTFLKVSFG
jgi:sigma-B regulation protein RsbU (phosphoserine phosphatase)